MSYPSPVLWVTTKTLHLWFQMYVPQVLRSHPTERTVLAPTEQQSYGTMDNTCSQAEGIRSYATGPALVEQASGASLWVVLRGRTQDGALGPGLAELIPCHLLLSTRCHLCIPACRKGTEIIHCVVCSCAGRLKSRCLGTDCFPGCLHTLWNKQVERGDIDPQGLHFC